MFDIFHKSPFHLSSLVRSKKTRVVVLHMKSCPVYHSRLREISQRIRLEKFQNSPRRAIQKEVTDDLKSNATSSNETAVSKNHHSYIAMLTDLLRIRYDELLSSAHGKNTLNNFKKLSEKVNQAMHVKAHNVEQTIRSSMSTLQNDPNFTFSNMRADYVEKMRSTLSKNGKKKPRYTSAIPFDQRWDNITQTLAVLGRVSTGNRVKPLPDSGEAFREMWKSVDSATKSALWQTYICKDDVVGQRTIQKLLEAHQRGCETELLYDCGGNISGRWRLVERLRASGASVVAYRPFFRSLFRYLFKGFDWKRSPGLRNHRKILITDGTTGYCGGLNVGNEYCGRDEGGTGKFRDTHVRLEGPCVAHLQEVYNDTKNPHEWKFGWRRWRQIASARLNDTANEMNLQFIKPLKTATDQVKRRSGIFVRKQLTKDGEDPSKNKRLEKQRRQLLKLLKKYNPAAFEEVKETTPHEPEKPAAKTEFEELLKQKAATYSKTHLVDTEEGGPKPPISARRRKTLNAYYRAFKELSSLPHKRTYTQVLRELPLADTEAVPEAELYGKLRPSTTQVLSCNPRYKDYSIQYSMWQVTRKCHRRIWITTPYYLPNKKLFKALLHAAERGVDVRLLSGSNKTTDPWWMWHASNYITDRLLRAGVKIYEFKGSQIMHAKTVVVDSIWSSIGSYNWDVMSNRNLEVCLCHLDLEVAREMEEQFLKDLSESTEVQLEEHNKRSYLLRMASWMFYHGVYLLDKITFRAFCDQDLEDTPNIPEQR